MSDRNLFRKKLRWCLTLICCTVGLVRVGAQNPVLLECMKINQAYLASNHLSFNLQYRYAEEATPTTYLDSSFGSFKMDGSRYWGSIDSVEYMQNDSFQVVAFKLEKVLSLGLAASDPSAALPLSHWDSLFFQNNRFTFAMGTDAGLKKITVNYSSGLPYKKCEIWYDSVSYRLGHVRYAVSEFASDPNFYSLPGPGDYGIVDMIFSNYQTGTFTDSVFLSSTYFTRSGANYVVASGFTGYEIFLSSPGL